VQTARDTYGVVLETVDGKVDLAATEALRKRIRQSELKESNALPTA
jgi:hypothetical protein